MNRSGMPSGKRRSHRDPADQIIVATARVHQLTLITADRRLRAYAHVQSLWDDV